MSKKETKVSEEKKPEAEILTNLINTKPKDSSAKLIFGDPILCAQFLRDYIDIPILKNVQPEDITDVTSRYVHMFTNERDSDVVKKIHIKDDESSFYLISLIEHKSNVDYNVVMQVLRYMAFIWEDYEKEMEMQSEGITKQKGFKYPPIIPIVFYDGDQNWTAATRLRDRIFLSDAFGDFIPDYRCLLMQLKDCSSEEIMEKNNELIIGTLLEIINVPHKDAEEFKEKVKERKVAELFRYFKGLDVQTLRKEADERERKAHEDAYEEGIGKLIKAIKSISNSRLTAMQQLMEQYGLDEVEAGEKIALYW